MDWALSRVTAAIGAYLAKKAVKERVAQYNVAAKVGYQRGYLLSTLPPFLRELRPPFLHGPQRHPGWTRSVHTISRDVSERVSRSVSQSVERVAIGWVPLSPRSQLLVTRLRSLVWPFWSWFMWPVWGHVSDQEVQASFVCRWVLYPRPILYLTHHLWLAHPYPRPHFPAPSGVDGTGCESGAGLTELPAWDDMW